MRPRSALVAFLLMLLLAAVPAAGQVLRFERLTQDDGLSQNVVNVISQDSFGFIWIGTQDGLNRFDGYEVRSFRPDGTAGSLGDGHVLALRPDGDGTMWIGTREGGLARWDAASETFQSWRHDPARSDTLSIDYVRSILQNPDGSFWIGTIEGLNHFDRRSGRMQRYLPDANDPRSVAMTDVGLLFRDSAGMVWASYRKGALDSIDANRNIRHRQAELDALGVTGSITTAANDRAGRTWLGTSTGQLLSWDPKTQQFARAGEVSAEAAIKSLLVDRAGALWIATRGQGLLRRDPTSGQLRTLRHDPSDPHSIPSDLVESLFEDRTGVLWVGTQLGVARHDPASAAFRVYRAAPVASDAAAAATGPADSYVWAIESDRAGNLWTGSDGGLSLFDRTTGAWRSWTPKVDDPAALASETVTAVLIDRSGAVWAGGNRGLSRLDRAANRFESWSKETPGELALPHNRIFDLLETADGSILIGTANGVVQWDPQRRGFVPLGPADFQLPIFTMAEDRDGAIWIGTFQNGLYRLDRARQEVSRLTGPRGENLITPQQISSTLVDSRGRLWVGTSRGLFRRDPGASAVRHYRSTDGLPNGSIMGIVEDQQGSIWISTNDGMARHDPARGTFRAYKVRDGLPSNEFNQMAAGRSARGELLFGTPAGAVIFDPEGIRADSRPPQVAITGFELFNVRVPIRRDANAEGFTLGRSIMTTPALTLTHHESVVTLTFAGLHYAAPRETRYAYRLEGWDDAWREATAQRRSATYTNLPAGQYRFRVRAANKDGVWNEAGASLAIRVLPPWWKTWWAYTLYVVLLLAAIAAFVSQRVRALRKRQRELETLVQVRTAQLETSERRALEANQAKSVFLANMSHELRTPLNAVLGFSQLLERSPAIRGDDRSSLDIIRRSGEHLLGLINDVLSLSKIEAGHLTLEARPFSLRAVIESVEAMMRQRADRQRLQLEVHIDGELPDSVTGDEGKLRQVLVNLLGNAVKFTERGTVSLRVAWRDGRAAFEVTDSGHGIAPAELETLFSAFVQTESGRKSKEGTGLGLVITREIVRLMDGELTVRSELGAGSTFAFEAALPMATEVRIAESEDHVLGLAPGQRAKHVIVADDTPENRLLIVRLLGTAGFRVSEAANGEEAINVWRQESADLILMDMRMPVLDGREAIRRIRALEKNEGLTPTPIVALTASAFEHERDEILSCGADDFLTKPFREAQLFRIIEARTGALFLRESEAQRRTRGGEESAAEPVTREHIERLRGDERRELRDALELGDVESAAAVAARIRQRDEPLGRDLLSEIRAFRVDHLLDLLEPAGGNA